MGTNLRHLDEETTAYSLDDALEQTISLEQAISALRELGEAIERASNLVSDENSTVDAFLETLQSIPVPISRISIDPSLLTDQLGRVEDARINAQGILIISSHEGGIETLDLTSIDNRDLLISVLKDIMEKLKGVPSGTQTLTEILEVEPTDMMGDVEIHVVEEPQENDELVEPNTPETFSPPRTNIDELVEERLFVVSEPAEPPIDPISLPPPVLIGDEPSPILREVDDLLFTPNVYAGSLLRRFRGQVQRQRREASQSKTRVRRLREAQVQMMRAGASEPWVWDETGVLASLKKLFSRIIGKR